MPLALFVGGPCVIACAVGDFCLQSVFLVIEFSRQLCLSCSWIFCLLNIYVQSGMKMKKGIWQSCWWWDCSWDVRHISISYCRRTTEPWEIIYNQHNWLCIIFTQFASQNESLSWWNIESCLHWNIIEWDEIINK